PGGPGIPAPGSGAWPEPDTTATTATSAASALTDSPAAATTTVARGAEPPTAANPAAKADDPTAGLTAPPEDLAQLLSSAPSVQVAWALPWEKQSQPTALPPKSAATRIVVAGAQEKAPAPLGPPAPAPAVAAKPAKPSPSATAATTAAAAAQSTASGQPAAGVSPGPHIGPALEKEATQALPAGATPVRRGPTGALPKHDPRRETHVIEHTFLPQQKGATKLMPMPRNRDGGHADALFGARATLRVDAQQIDNLINLVGEMVLCRNRLVEATGLSGKRSTQAQTGRSAAQRLSHGRKRRAPAQTQAQSVAAAAAAAALHTGGNPGSEAFPELVEMLDKATTAVHKAVMRLRMVSLEPFFQRFPRLVHDLSGQLGKMIRLEIAGEATELDKSVVEAISDPLVHLVRNAAYHGIEAPDERVKAGKPRAGTIFLSARPEGESVAIMIEDDGRGLDIARIAEKAVRTGVLTPEQVQRMPPHEIIELVFLPGFTTEDKVGAISGRGVGLDVVREYINQIGGSVSLSTEPGNGTRITLNLPLTLAILRALLVEVNGMTFAVPLSAVRKTRRLKPGDARLLHGQWLLTDLNAGGDAAIAPNAAGSPGA
ncbi:MAG: chemotaxis protein CheA, partial [Planctomycetota bacterium]